MRQLLLFPEKISENCGKGDDVWLLKDITHVSAGTKGHIIGKVSNTFLIQFDETPSAFWLQAEHFKCS